MTRYLKRLGFMVGLGLIAYGVYWLYTGATRVTLTETQWFAIFVMMLLSDIVSNLGSINDSLQDIAKAIRGEESDDEDEDE